MALKDVYINAIQKVIDGTLMKEDLWDVLEEHLGMEKDRNAELQKLYDEYKKKYENLLELIKKAFDEHEKFTGKII